MNVLVKLRDFGSSSIRSTCAVRTCGILQPALRREIVQLVVRHGGPEEIREARCQLELAQRIDARLLAAVLQLEQEIRPDEHGLDRQLHPFFERVAALRRAIVESEERRDVRGFDRPAIGFAQERAQDLFGRLARLQQRAAGLDAEQAIVQRQLFGRHLGGFLLDRQTRDRDRRSIGDHREQPQTAREPDANSVSGGRAPRPPRRRLVRRGRRGPAVDGQRDTRGAIDLQRQRAHSVLAIDRDAHIVVAVEIDGDRRGEFLAGREFARRRAALRPGSTRRPGTS